MLSDLATSLRTIILLSSQSYPEPAISLFNRSVANNRMRKDIYNELMDFTHAMADVAAEAVVVVAKAELMEELPQERLEREEREHKKRIDRLNFLRSIPEEKRTERQKHALKYFPISTVYGRPSLYDIGINRDQNYYASASPLHEPFATLFSKCPDIAIGLVRDLINHATKGWRQVQLLDCERKRTPIPVVINFPWGEQKFWGDSHVYGWFSGDNMSGPLECAFRALTYWAFKQIEDRRPTDEVIRAVVERNECFAVLGLALVLALETYTVSETTLPIVTCQRLWLHDIARIARGPMPNLFGLDFLQHMTGKKAKAKEFLESRHSRKCDVRQLAIKFAMSSNDHLRQSFKEALARFPEDLPFETEEECFDGDVIASLKDRADRWAGFGDIQNYRSYQIDAEKTIIYYEAPVALTHAQEKHFRETSDILQEYNITVWATRSLETNTLVKGISLADAMAFAKGRDNDTILVQRCDAEEPQTTISAVAAIVICFGPRTGEDYDWAWNVMERVLSMKEPQDRYYGSRDPTHPANYLAIALVHDRRSLSPRKETLCWIFQLTFHPIDDVVQRAFKGLFMDLDVHVQWVAAQLAMDLSIYYWQDKKGGRGDNTHNQDARILSFARALDRLEKKDITPLSPVPPAWVKVPNKSLYERIIDMAGWGDYEEETRWVDANPSFDPYFAEKIFPHFPLEAWCQTIQYKPMLAAMFQDLATWTAERLMPSWNKGRHGRRSYSGKASPSQWNRALGDLFSRVSPFFDKEFVSNKFLAPFLTEGKEEEDLSVLASFTNWTVIRHIIDAPIIPSNTLELLDDCVDRVIRDRCFDQNDYLAGIVDNYLEIMIKALFFISIEQEASAAARFANGNWSEIKVVMPIVDKLVKAIGWSPIVMGHYLTLCEQAGNSYPLDLFACQVNAVIGSLGNAKNSWIGTELPARIAEIVQRLADANFPLHAEQARELLKILDALIDMGDRRSAALEQSEAFRGIQM